MGFRIIELDVPDDRPTILLLEQLSAFAESRGMEAYVELPEPRSSGFELTLQGNSSYLNRMTPCVVHAALQIARDIDPDSAALQGIASEIGLQLEEQIVDWSDTQTITTARIGRELTARLDGDSGHPQLLEEVTLHLDRVAGSLAAHAGLSGPRAWRDRDRLDLLLRVDGLALIAAVRRFQRVAEDLSARLGGAHLVAALATFRSITNGIVRIRDVAEHIDEYGIGAGRTDRPAVEPGQAIEIVIEENELWISARSARIGALGVGEATKSLARCIAAATDHHAVFHYMPGFADFDFVRYDEAGDTSIVTRDEEDENMRQARAMMEKAFDRSVRPAPSPCANCGLDL